MLISEDLTHRIIGCAIDVHKELGPGLLESAYEECICFELGNRSIQYERQVNLPIMYKGNKLDAGYRLDLVIENKIVLELKSIEKISPVHEAQLLTYLKLTKLPLGFLINFNVPVLKDGIIRRIL